MKSLSFLLFFYWSTQLFSQSFVLEQIEKNNPALLALLRRAEAENIANQTGIYPEDPGIEYHYLGGNKTLYSELKNKNLFLTYLHQKTYLNKENEKENKSSNVSRPIRRREGIALS
jgi:hypothetical protein